MSLVMFGIRRKHWGKFEAQSPKNDDDFVKKKMACTIRAYASHKWDGIRYLGVKASLAGIPYT